MLAHFQNFQAYYMHSMFVTTVTALVSNYLLGRFAMKANKCKRLSKVLKKVNRLSIILMSDEDLTAIKNKAESLANQCANELSNRNKEGTSL